jgi:hypothetical protein
VQPVGLLELELPCALYTVGFCFAGPVRVDGFLGKVVGAATRGYKRCPAVAVVLLAMSRGGLLFARRGAAWL